MRINNKKTARQGWDDIYKKMHEEGDDILLISDAIDMDSKDWEWKYQFYQENTKRSDD